MTRFGDPRPLDPEDSVEAFRSGRASLDTWLIRHAAQAVAARSARVYVVCDADGGGRVVGYHALAAGSIEHGEAHARTARGMPRHPIPVVVLARLAVDERLQGVGLGTFLLRDAMARSLAASRAIGARALIVHAVDQVAAAFYGRWGFEPSPTDPLNLQLLMKDLERSAG